MDKFEISHTGIDDVYIIVPRVNLDERGGLVKDFSKEMFAHQGFSYEIKEAFFTINRKGTLRGIHFQRIKQQGKLITCLTGKVSCVVVDLRYDSKTFKKWERHILSQDNHKEILLPGGCGLGYLVLEDDTIVSYKCDEFFYPEYDDVIQWNDAELGIDWNLKLVEENIYLSEKDRNANTFSEFKRKYQGLK